MTLFFADHLVSMPRVQRHAVAKPRHAQHTSVAYWHSPKLLQACIDMNKVMEVARADDVTGNPFSVAITAPDRVHFVKGTCKEESAWWLEVGKQ